MPIGPLDRRILQKRCQACARRRIKCEGEPPCLYCTKKKITCSPQVAKRPTGVVFLNQTVHSQLCPSNAVQEVSTIPEPMRRTINGFIAHFFSEFIVKNDFAGGSLDVDDIISSFQTSPSLYHASIAVAALDMSKNPLLPSTQRKSATVAALTSYQTSINKFCTDIQKTKLNKNDADLWTTFFLGIFELMYDVSGEGWVKHILYGTSKILQIRGPEAHLMGRGRSFFLTVRPFEICRSLIYSEPSFLSNPNWTSLVTRMWTGDLAKQRLPKEELFDLMLACSSLSTRVWNVVDPAHAPAESIALFDLAAEGLLFRSSIETWHSNFRTRLECNEISDQDPWTILAEIYYHAISIYLSGLFDYRPQFDQITSPRLPFGTVQSHGNCILSKTERALRTTRLAGIWFFFPLRVAGARSQSIQQMSSILIMLKDISTRGFVVAEAFILDLNTLWEKSRTQEDLEKV